MKGWMILALVAMVSGTTAAQSKDFDLERYNMGFNRIQKGGMLILGSWAGINMIGSGIPLLAMSDETMNEVLRYLFVMNIGWNFINAGLAGSGYFTCCRKPASAYTLGDTLKRQYRSEKTFLFNAGLDVGYMAFGLYLVAKADSTANPAMFEGFGYSLMLQGGFLFAFDIAMQIVHARHRKGLDSYIDSLPVSQ